MLDLWLFLMSVGSLIWMLCIDVICGRLKAQDGAPPSQWIWNQPRNLTRYWHLARAQGWPIGSLFGAGIALLCCVIALCGVGIHFLP
jgi:hypothetical protein